MVCWEIRDGARLGPSPFLVMGIVNITPDSFSDGGRFLEPAAAVMHGLALAARGADILDLGGESTRPGSDEVPADEEWRRLEPVFELLQDAPPARGLVLSVDTWRAETAARALAAGAAIVNDISACRFDPALVDVLVQHQPGYVLMHAQGRPKTMQQNPHYDDVVDNVLRFLEERLAALVRAGLAESRIVLDPGIGFGKTVTHNLALLAGLERLAVLGRPVLMGLSRKRFLQGFVPADAPDEAARATALQLATQAATVLAARHGARIHRVHDVAQTRQTLDIVAAVEAAGGEGPCST
ncbi:dihydropteroate synthase [Megalodesulfovibrio gigas]|uniref:Dihydropteroate synthase n=1 Tax=Megalodesulfovibrio gigas (strain ATCC 19364 / DSM 1382 / NCIMB 9332 / VKM B-1759) TaxID=1121448 RepID=T2G7R2_MEGG1|nr:dihydropteroate synthase [Megalodesulfovibrio gigas]AGW12229.1 putative dihydropteroate synthase [Megalodesulfovibrio gigas DSM 1382 = ATCC 19364]